MSETRLLVVLRHATAQAGLPDVERPLTPHGVEEARAAGRWLRARGLAPDFVLCSPAVRTRQTWARVTEATSREVPVSIEPAIYEASIDDLMSALRDLDALDVPPRTVVLVGHAPGLPMLAHDLCGGRGDDDAILTITRGFVPGSAAVLSFEGGWADLTTGYADLHAVRPGSATDQ